MRPAAKPASGFTMVEILVAMVVLAVGLLGMAAMSVLVIRGNRGASDLTNATNICQLKVEELKDIPWGDVGILPAGDVDRYEQGLEDGLMAVEGGTGVGNGLGPQGLTRTRQFALEQVTPGPCLNETDESDPACRAHMDSLGPYRYIRGFVTCNGEDYSGFQPTPVPPTTMNSNSVDTTAFVAGNYPAEHDCHIVEGDNLTRVEKLACEPEDIAGAPGTDVEKKVKVVCGWMARDGRCHAIGLETTLVNTGS